MTAPHITVTAETYFAHDDGDGPDVIVVRVHGEEVGAYCIADDPEAERGAMQRMVDAIHAAGLARGRAEGLEQAATYLVAVADDPVYDPADDRLDGLDVDGVLRTMAAEIRAMMAPATTTERAAKERPHINGAESWESNPWCWCVSFRRVQP